MGMLKSPTNTFVYTQHSVRFKKNQRIQREALCKDQVDETPQQKELISQTSSLNAKMVKNSKSLQLKMGMGLISQIWVVNCCHSSAWASRNMKTWVTRRCWFMVTSTILLLQPGSERQNKSVLWSHIKSFTDRDLEGRDLICSKPHLIVFDSVTLVVLIFFFFSRF